MKVVLFCGGLGLRMREASERIPKPMIEIGNRPLLMHIMKYYAHYGHKEFVLCLGYNAHIIKEYFLDYNEALSNDFVLSDGGKTVQLLRSDTQDWRLTFVDTGLHATIGQRLRFVREYVGGDDFFLANYADGLTDAPLPQMIANLRERGKVASFLCVRPRFAWHVVSVKDGNLADKVEDVRRTDFWINGGYFVFRNDIFDYIGEGEELVEEPFRRLMAEEELLTYQYQGFWAAMDTLKDKQNLESLYESGCPPWAVWETPPIESPGVGRALGSC